MIEDYHNFTLKKCRGLIKEYQETTDTHIFDLLLAKFDKYLAYIIYDLSTKFLYLREETLQDLYHTSILGFYKAMTKFDCDLNPEMILLVIKAYVRNELDIFYAYKKREQVYSDVALQLKSFSIEKVNEEMEKFYAEFSAHLLIIDDSLNSAQKILLEEVYYKGISRKDLASKYEISERKVKHILSGALIKLRSKIMPDNKVKKRRKK